MSRGAGDAPSSGVSRRTALAAGGIAATVFGLASRAQAAAPDAALIDSVEELRRLRQAIRNRDAFWLTTRGRSLAPKTIEDEEAYDAVLLVDFATAAQKIAATRATSPASLREKAIALRIATDFYRRIKLGVSVEDQLEVDHLMGWTLADDVVRLLR